MTPKEKAEELVNKVVDTIHDDVTVAEFEIGMWMNTFKQCALIAVDEIIESFEQAGKGECTTVHIVEYWLEVKTEIEKL